ncbi:pyridoxal phosphate-dependent aminotransferase [Burkholderia gladioli]|uniref:pyridoxal phosphate-dependent aminotransferase n=1 Tax=Burkholderia gladioli TaxID=28095 RepID=UPI0022D10EC1|nr:aminotransferase class I/II-fold pyridoxal phosphate-dependent enzyme [Burkholderia gladioli]MDA0574077.1 aminotransferase class I/II-fold pyridoxal phosphate-dependent enzyme [Burkholderia gladioli]MDA0602354.1 aminotransferase class I/II-fold pyridoxal phosphate-dependent enzyme [Burkholderia gladioli]
MNVMPPPPAQRMQEIAISAAVDVANAILSGRNRHGDPILMHDGEPDFPVPPAIIEATRRALAAGRTGYDALTGVTALRERICLTLREADGLDLSPDNVLVSNGSSQAIFQILLAYVNPGDHVLVPAPAWPSYLAGIRLAGGIPVTYPCLDAELDLDRLDTLATKSRAKLVIVNSPHNPTGVVLPDSVLLGIHALAEKHDMLIISDEAYEAFVFGRARPTNFQALVGSCGQRILSTRSFSKTYAMTGFRIGYLYAERAHVARCAAIQCHVSDNACTFAQYGALAALDTPAAQHRRHAALIEQRIHSVYSGIREWLPCPVPEGGFYVFPSLASVLTSQWRDAPTFVSELFQATGVRAVPGEAFGLPGHMRLSIAATDAPRIEAATKRIIDFIRRG